MLIPSFSTGPISNVPGQLTDLVGRSTTQLNKISQVCTKMLDGFDAVYRDL